MRTANERIFRHSRARYDRPTRTRNESTASQPAATMPLYQADILLTRARLFGLRDQEADYPWGSPQADLAEARRLIEKHGYHRRDQELADAEAALDKRET
ncbi:MAG: hypothetical protein LJE70_05390 [Chromatiaceae bacterium]|nr:hypothetical protein [Chromatiaceae bacterium]